MVELSRRQKLKKNALEDFVVRVAEWIKNNRTTFYTGAGIAAGLLVFGIFFLTRYQALAARGEERLTSAQAQVYQGQNDQALVSLDDIINQYSGSIDVRARLIKSEILMEQKRYKEVEETLGATAQMKKPALMIPLVIAVLAEAQENAGDHAAAIKSYADFTTRFSDHFLAPRMYESLARVYALSGNNVEASNINTKIVTLFPDSPWVQRAQERMSATVPSSPVNK